ncbi:hypothetical protein M5K25_027099 [Dendrobium thyrsiflorum]|uniref:Vacuolar import/degradation Vid27 C-terminal domain-containing protein n=1 Tax=Dendrobium thyrsiflorum TaxID=117978 RepID=A0ABD0TZ51_DENTH
MRDYLRSQILDPARPPAHARSGPSSRPCKMDAGRDQTCNYDSASSRDQTTAYEPPTPHTLHHSYTPHHSPTLCPLPDFSPFDSAIDTSHDHSPLPVHSDDAKPTLTPIRTALLLPVRFRNSLPTKQLPLPLSKQAVDEGGIQSLALGALDNSSLVSDSGILVVRNFNNGVHGKGVLVRISGHQNNYSIPQKALLMRGETNMLLMSQRNAAKPHASGVDQFDIETIKVVTYWKFEKDGTDITRRDNTNDSKGSQLDPSESTFLGLDDNRFCQWDMRDRRGGRKGISLQGTLIFNALQQLVMVRLLLVLLMERSGCIQKIQ